MKNQKVRAMTNLEILKDLKTQLEAKLYKNIHEEGALKAIIEAIEIEEAKVSV
jgi:hypothetical protein